MSRLASGDTLGGYRIEGLLGEGGMGIVYRATQLSLGRQAALKVLHSGLAAEPDARRRFLREGVVAARVKHPRLVSVYEVGEAGGRLFLACELIEGPTLRQTLARRGRLTPAEAVELGSACADALAELHRLRVLHRDIKPENIFLAKGRGPLVGDLGIAKDLQAPAGQRTQQGVLLGTPAYMAPELAQGQPASVASDLYSVGIVLYECLTGSPPFQHSDPLELLRLHSSSAIPRPETLRPAQLAAIVLALTAKEPLERPPSARALKDALDALPPLDRTAPEPAPSSRTISVRQAAALKSRQAPTVVAARPSPRLLPALLGGVALLAALGPLSRRPGPVRAPGAEQAARPPARATGPVAVRPVPALPDWRGPMRLARELLTRADEEGQALRTSSTARGEELRTATVLEDLLEILEKSLASCRPAFHAAAAAGSDEAFEEAGVLMALELKAAIRCRAHLWEIMGSRTEQAADGGRPELMVAKSGMMGDKFELQAAKLALSEYRNLPEAIARSAVPECVAGRVCSRTLFRRALPQASLQKFDEEFVRDLSGSWPRLVEGPGTPNHILLVDEVMFGLQFMGIRGQRKKMMEQVLADYAKVPDLDCGRMLIRGELAADYAEYLADDGSVSGVIQAPLEQPIRVLTGARNELYLQWPYDFHRGPPRAPVGKQREACRFSDQFESILWRLDHKLKECVHNAAVPVPEWPRRP